jgi:serine/threonine protein kinase
MKVISKADINRLDCKQQINTEISIHSTLSHPYIVQFYTNREDNENIYIIEELATDGHLYNKLLKKGRLSEQIVSSICNNIL